MIILSSVQPIIENNNNEWIGYLVFFIITMLAVAGFSYIIFGIFSKIIEKTVTPIKQELTLIKEQIEEIKNNLKE